MPKYWIRKQGRQHSIYTVPFDNYEEPPQGGEFALTVEAESIAQLEAQIGTKDYVLIGPPARGSAEARACASDGHLPQVDATVSPGAFLATAATLGIPQAKIDELSALKTQKQGIPMGTGALVGAIMGAMAQPRQLDNVNQDNQLYDKALLEYRMLVIRNLAALDKVQPIKKFLGKLWPDIVVKLVDIELEEANNE